MRNWLRSRHGFNADGRMLGLALAAAMDKQRQEATREVEKYLRELSTAQKETV